MALGVAYFLEGAGYIITGTFLVDVATDIGPAWVAAGCWTVAGLAGVPSCVVWARVAARRGRGPTLVAALAVQAVGLALPALGGLTRRGRRSPPSCSAARSSRSSC